jgi:hypothetical protein
MPCRDSPSVAAEALTVGARSGNHERGTLGDRTSSAGRRALDIAHGIHPRVNLPVERLVEHPFGEPSGEPTATDVHGRWRTSTDRDPWSAGRLRTSADVHGRLSPALQAGGRRFESDQLHHITPGRTGCEAPGRSASWAGHAPHVLQRMGSGVVDGVVFRHLRRAKRVGAV